MKIFSRVSQPDYQTVEGMDPQDRGVPPGISCWKREGRQQDGDPVSLKETSNSCSNLSATLEDKTEAQMMMSPEDRSVLHIPGLYTLISPQVPKDKLEGFAVPHRPPAQRDHID